MNAREHNDTYMAINLGPRSMSASLESVEPEDSIVLDGELIYQAVSCVIRVEEARSVDIMPLEKVMK